MQMLRRDHAIHRIDFMISLAMLRDQLPCNSHSPNSQLLEASNFQSLAPFKIPLKVMPLGSFWSLVLITLIIHRYILFIVSRPAAVPFYFLLCPSGLSSLSCNHRVQCLLTFIENYLYNSKVSLN